MTDGERLPFDGDFQRLLFRLLVEDDAFAAAMAPYLRPTYFDAAPLRWGWERAQKHLEHYGVTPSLKVLVHEARQLDPQTGPAHAAALESLSLVPVRDEQWLRDATLDFVRRSIFTRAVQDSIKLYNAGRVVESYDRMQERMDELYRVTSVNVDRSWFYESLGRREAKRSMRKPSEEAVATGMPWLDAVFNGVGPVRGEFGLWIADAKVGKTTMLVNHGRVATTVSFKRTLHIVLEAGREMIENRYDSSITGELYSMVKWGKMDAEAYARASELYKHLRGLLVVRGMVDGYDYTIEDIDAELRDLRRSNGWVADCVIVDYGDLLSGRGGRRMYRSKFESEEQASRDLKSLANRGYVVWSAAQVQRPKEDQDKPGLIKARQIAGVYDKVRVADFIGSLNQTTAEKDAGIMRVYAEVYRDNPADKWRSVRYDPARMMIRAEEGLVSPSVGEAQPDAAFGWSPTQGRIPGG